MTTTSLRPSANGSNIDFTPSAGANYQCVSDDNDGTNVGADSAGEVYDVYDIDPSGIPAGSTINSVTIRININNSAEWFTCCYISSTNYKSAENLVGATSSYENEEYTWTTNPATSSAWLLSELSTTEFGMGFTNDLAQCREVWVIVDYTAGLTEKVLGITGSSVAKVTGVTVTSIAKISGVDV